MFYIIVFHAVETTMITACSNYFGFQIVIEISVASLHTFSDVSHVISTGDFNARTGPYQTMDSDQFACFVTLSTCSVDDPLPKINVLTYII